MAVAKRVRLAPEARRQQLVDLGVHMLATRTLDELSVEDLAEQAGISRGLLFHYFKNKQDFHLAVARAAADDLLARTEPDPELPSMAQLAVSVLAFVDYVSEKRDAYVGLVRGAASGDANMRTIFDDTRAEMARRVLDNLHHLGLPNNSATELAVRGWVAFVEEATVQWSIAPTISRDQLLSMLTQALPALVSTTVEVPRRSAEPAVSTGSDGTSPDPT